MTEHMQNHQTPDTGPANGGRWLPSLRSRWWTVLLGLSLMANLLIGGMIAGRFIADGPPDRLVGASYVQLVPRRFFHDLPRERRRELMELVRGNRIDLRALRQATEQTSLKLADALSAVNYNEADVARAVEEFSSGTESLAARGGTVVLEIVKRLTPEERLALAEAIRARGKRR
jgi:uncharacterized membrane protein